eukprot:scaffold58843_cov28-Attheya_sp.AAC.2
MGCACIVTTNANVVVTIWSGIGTELSHNKQQIGQPPTAPTLIPIHRRCISTNAIPLSKKDAILA